MNEGRRMYELCGKLFPICRSITGNGVRETFRILQEELPGVPFEMHEIKTGTPVLDWT